MQGRNDAERKARYDKIMLHGSTQYWALVKNANKPFHYSPETDMQMKASRKAVAELNVRGTPSIYDGKIQSRFTRSTPEACETAMKLTQQVKFSDSVFAQEVDGEMVLLDMNSENYFGLDEVGTSIWQAIEAEDGMLERVLGVLLDEYDVAEDILRQDLLAFVEKLTQSGLVEVLDEAG